MERDHKSTEDRREFHILYISLLRKPKQIIVPDGLNIL